MSLAKPSSPSRRRRTAENLKRALALYSSLRDFSRWTNRSPSASRSIDVAEERVEHAAARYLAAHGVATS